MCALPPVSPPPLDLLSIAGPVKGHIRGMECVLLKTLQRLVYSENLGKTLVSMRLQVLEDGGGLLSVCMNAMITCALLAGLKLQEIPHAVSFGLVNRNGSPGFLLDPTDEELKAYCTGGVTLLSDPNTGMHIEHSARFTTYVS